MKRILITGAGGNAAQNFIRSLRMAEENFYIVGTDTSPIHMECTDLEARYILPRFTDPEYLTKLNRIIQKEQVELIHPQPDVEVGFITQYRDKINAKSFLPSLEAIEICHDKTKTNECLKSHGVSVPHSVHVDSMEALPDLFYDLKRLFDIVWVRATRGAGSKAALPVKTLDQARNWIKYWIDMKGMTASDFMISEFLPGKEYAFQSLWHEGKLITSMARERVEYMFGNLMPSGQSSSPSIAKTVQRNDVNEVAVKSILAVDPKPHGVFCVDMKENSAATPCVTEINLGRFFTTSNFFSQAGSNMPYYYVQLAFGEKLPQLPQYNALEADLYWVRGVDREPRLFQGTKWSANTEY